MSVTNRLVFDVTDAASIAASSSIGAYLRAEDGTLLTHTTNGGREELDVNDSTAAGILTTIDSVLDNIYIDTQALVVDLAAIETELLDQGTVLDNIYTDTQAMVVDLAAIEAELLDQGTTLDSIETSVQLIDDLVLYEDAAASGGEAGVQILGVRQDTLGSLASADGDFTPLSIDADGALYVTLSDDLNVDVNDVCNVAIENTATAVSASAVNIVTAALANRSKVFVANEGNHSLYIGKTGVTAVNGFPLHPGMQHEYNIGPAVVIQAIGEASASAEDLRVMELS